MPRLLIFFFQSIDFIMPQPTANGAAETGGSAGESVLLECKNWLHAEMVRASLEWKLAAMIRGKHLVIDI